VVSKAIASLKNPIKGRTKMTPQTAIKLYDSRTSPNCHRVKVVLEEKRLPYELIAVDLKAGEQKRPEFLRLNPYGKVPVIVDGETVIYESCIINEYLEEKYPEHQLMPAVYGLRAKIRILIDYGLNHFAPPYQRIRQEMRGKAERERDASVIENSVKELVRLFQRFEGELEGKSYLAGDFSLLDAALIPRYLRMEKWGVGILPNPALPRMTGWLARMKERPSVQTFLASVSF
jgi:glutathione S-transferase